MKTINRAVITPITAVLNTASKRKWCDRPAFERPRVPVPKTRWLTRAEADKLIAAAGPHLKPLLVFLLNTGARLNEALRLEWTEVDLQAPRVVFHDTKNGASRGVPLNNDALLALANLAHRDGRVFLSPRGQPYYDSAGRGGSPIKTAFKGAIRRAEINDLRVRDLRHTFAPWLVMAGVPLRTVAKLLGHKTLAMVYRYSHLSPEHLRDAVGPLSLGAEPVQSENHSPQPIEVKR